MLWSMPKKVPAVNKLAALLRPYTTAAIAQACNVKITTVHLWRNGETTPGIDSVEKVAALAHVPVEEALRAIVHSRKDIRRQQRPKKAKKPVVGQTPVSPEPEAAFA